MCFISFQCYFYFLSAKYILFHLNANVCDTDQYGVPTKELAGEATEAEPKSASLT